MNLAVGDLGCAPDEANHNWSWDNLIRQNVCARCGILESWVEQQRINGTARRLLDGTDVSRLS